MATKTTKKLNVEFACDDGKYCTYSLDDYKEDLTDSEIETQCNAMLDSGAIANGGSAAVAVVGAKKVNTTTVDVVFV